MKYHEENTVDLLIILRNRDSYRDHPVNVPLPFLIIVHGHFLPFTVPGRSLTVPKRLGTMIPHRS